MSVVTNILLCLGVGEVDDGKSAAIDSLAEFLGSNRLTNLSDFAAGPKCMECDIFGCGANYLDVEGFIAAVRAAPWIYPWQVQLLLKEQEADTFEFVPLDMERDGFHR